MTIRTLRLLDRVGRRGLDRDRQALADETGELARVEAEIESLAHRFAEEVRLALTLPDGARLAASFAGGHRRHEARLRAERERLAGNRASLEMAIRQRGTELATLDRAARQLAAGEQEAAARSEQKRLDEAALTRHTAGHCHHERF